jgi:hypothetical protein
LPTPAGPYMNNLSRLFTGSGFLPRNAMIVSPCPTVRLRSAHSVGRLA